MLISEDKVSRGKWPMGRVERLLPGKDNLIRTVIVKTKKGLLRRPVQMLHRLEANSTQFVNGEFGDICCVNVMGFQNMCFWLEEL